MLWPARGFNARRVFTDILDLAEPKKFISSLSFNDYE